MGDFGMITVLFQLWLYHPFAIICMAFALLALIRYLCGRIKWEK